MTDLDYIECAGVRVPEDWTIEQLRSALERRNIRFRKANEEEIMRVFGEAVVLKQKLGKEIDALKNEKAKLIVNIGKLKEFTR